MKKFLKKACACVMTFALAVTMLLGVGEVQSVSADDETIDLGYWTFIHQGTNTWGEAGNTGIISKVTMNDTGEVLDGWLSDDSGTGSETDPAYMQEQTATQISSGFTLQIANTGWDANWVEDTINPWSVEAVMRDIDISTHVDDYVGVYSVTFTAYATKNKYGYVTFGSDYEGTAPYGDAGLEEGSNDHFIEIYTYPVTYTYNFTNWTTSNKMSVTMMLGAFDSQYDYDGSDLSGVEDHGVENGWSGTVYVSDFTITRTGTEYLPHTNVEDEKAPSNPNASTDSSTGSTGSTSSTVTSTTTSTSTASAATSTSTTTSAKKLAKVKKVKAKSKKAGTLTISWKKVANAGKYKVKVGSKTYKTKKVKYTAKKLTSGKTYKVRVRAAKNGDYKAGAWSKAVKAKVK